MSNKKEKDRIYHFYKSGCGLLKTIICSSCGTQFTANHKRKYCKPECRLAYKRPFDDKHSRTCERCNTVYLPKYRAQRFCTKHCRRKGDSRFINSQHKFYNSKEWRDTKIAFKAAFTLINGIDISNQYCIECYKKQSRLNDMYAVDHIVRIKDGGTHEFSNLQSLCRHHHQSKSAIEGNSINNRNKGGRPKNVETEYYSE